MVDRINGYTSGTATFVNPTNYVISTDGTDYYANNAFHLVFGGPTDEGTVDGGDLLAVLVAAMGTGNVKLSFTDGTFTADELITQVDLVDNVEIEGAGIDATTIIQSKNDSLFEYIDDASPISNVYIHDLTLQGSNVGTSNVGIQTYKGVAATTTVNWLRLNRVRFTAWDSMPCHAGNINHLRVHDCIFDSPTDTYDFLAFDGSDVDISGCYSTRSDAASHFTAGGGSNIRIHDNTMVETGATIGYGGVSLEGYVASGYNDVWIRDNILNFCKLNLEVTPNNVDFDNIHILDNTLQNSTIGINGGDASDITNLYIRGNHIEPAYDPGTGKIPIGFYNQISNVWIDGNFLDSTAPTFSPGIGTGLAHFHWGENEGFITQTAGTTAALANGETFNHGLTIGVGLLPDSVVLTQSGGSLNFWISAWTNTTVTVGLEGAGDASFCWIAEYKPYK